MSKAFGFFSVFVFLQCVLFNAHAASEFSKSSDYKLLFVHHQNADFNPNQDIINPSTIEIQREEIQEVVAGSVMKSLIPLAGSLDKDLLTSLLTMTSVLQKELSSNLSKISVQELKAFPMIHDAYLVPWKNKNNDNFYRSEKISMSATDFVNVLGISPHSETFDDYLTGELKTLQKKLYKDSKSPSFLLGFRSYFFVHAQKPATQGNPASRAPSSSRFVLRILVGLKPGAFDFIKENDRVKLDRVVIPDVAGRGAVANLEFDIDIFDKEKPPVLNVELGEFEKFHNGEFIIKDSEKNKSALRIEGIVKMSYLKSRLGGNKIKKLEESSSKLAINFNFSKFTLELDKQEVSKLDVLVSPGIRIGQTNYVFGNLSMNEVNTEIQNEINNTIKAEIKNAKDGIMKKLFGERK
ncbi:MAG: hypothetical protein HYS98_02665 [Deltaproteobacteria bacterium]|nr:hypothetical protein [Deltaproteobacteria bacterium]